MPAAAVRASLTVETATEWAAGMPISGRVHLGKLVRDGRENGNVPSRALQKRSRSSETSRVRIGVPRTLTPRRSNTPIFSSWMPTLRAVCPPKVRRIPSGRSFSRMYAT